MAAQKKKSKGQAKSKSKSPGAQSIPIEWADADDLDTRYVNHVWLSQHGGDVFLTFGELLPFAPGRPPPKKAQIQPVARIALSPSALVRMTRLLKDHVPLPDSHEDGA